MSGDHGSSTAGIVILWSACFCVACAGIAVLAGSPEFGSGILFGMGVMTLAGSAILYKKEHER